VSFAAVTLCIVSKRVFVVVVVVVTYFLIKSVRKLFNTPLYFEYELFLGSSAE
jgi:uncharacterized protein HemY